ncbi:hypothetical protein JCM24511_06392 [Saitozyma sp. JCM 24511]|nr:hypothetical protein JCM24511_06392 [Saitozyma sp. JCM 24511]
MFAALYGGVALAAAGFAAAQNSSAGLDFGPVDFAGYNNYVYRDNVTAAQIVVTDSSSVYKPSRFITAFPNGNTGALVYFVPLNTTSNPSPLGTTLNFSSVHSVSGASNQTGLQGEVSVSGDLEFGVTLIGSVRTLRDYVESGGKTFHSVFNYTLGNYSASSVTLVRNWINGTTVQYFTWDAVSNGAFNVTPNANVTLPPNITLTRQNTSSNATLRFTSTFNFTGTTPQTPFIPLVGLGKDSLFETTSTAGSNVTSSLTNVLNAIQNNGSAVANQAAFLAYDSKFLAGGWRFLTYFGRDTLLALRLLLPVISPTSAEAILGAVLERLNTTGAVCHEETIGDYASFVNMQNNQSYLGNEPSYSYVMLDTDFLLLPAMADYFLTAPQGANRSTAFLQRNSTLVNGTFSELLIKNVDHVMNLSKPFATSPTKENLVPIRDPTVGDWRDSNTGLGYGIYPFDVETALIPAALRAIAQLSSAGVIPANYSTNASNYADVWEQQSAPFFEVSISPSAAQSSLENYVQKANLSDTLLYGAGSLNGSQNSSGNNGSQGWSAAGQTVGMDGGNSTFYGLSINANGSVVEVQHSDLGFVLLYGNNVSQSIIQATIEALQPYPRGLLTNVGMVVANAAYDTNTTNIETFNNLMYHGAVSWSWQQGLMASGISKQLGLCGLSNVTQLQTSIAGPQPSWCSNTNLTSALQQAQIRLWDSIVGSAPALYTEVLSPVWSSSNNTFLLGDLGAISPEGTEGDAIQLWSYGFLAQVDPRTGRPVAAGFP